MAKIYISPSTQEKNIGVANYKTEEMRCNMIADQVIDNLQSYDITIRRNKPSMSLSAVVKDSNSFKPDFHLAIHTNAYNSKSRGCEVFCHNKKSKGYNLALAVYKNISQITPSADRGVKEGENFYGPGKDMYELAHTVAPAALAEIIFHDNLEDVEWFLSHMKEIANAISQAIIKVMALKTKKVKRSISFTKKYSWIEVKLSIKERG
jgi:N-acetylmuramoyl-L-alanine amidase